MTDRRYAAFAGLHKLAEGPLAEVALAVQAAAAAGSDAPLLVFEDATGRVVDLDLRGTPEQLRARLGTPRGKGRPKLGVTAREVTLLPRHWDWLAAQPGGASVTLRKLVEQARRDGAQQRRAAQEAAYRFLSAMAGDLPAFEEASRALFADDRVALAARMAGWPGDVAAHALQLLDAQPEL
ncbi:hypothetical protein BKE38_01055 [Pseudoroseomonas deserti]|uniref:DUF2239 domain-containing protein n=1 Tax=Teichococcus deserti TaxID=1817963 RepID=A0A1V2HA70_9PROT|nr:DUF2239 family protein [Pseudoroseomonas deserti]ONG58962.1 hypothetical protein BKE38_01055 [Pseudoroseomonas deserti]